MAVKLMQDICGIDISSNRSKSWHDFDGMEFDYVISLCEEDVENCPVILTNAVKVNWRLPDPAEFEGDDEQVAKIFREIIFSIRTRLANFLAIQQNREWNKAKISEKEDRLQCYHQLGLVEELTRAYKNNLIVTPPRGQSLICINQSDLRLIIKDSLSNKCKGSILGSISITLCIGITLLSAQFKNVLFAPNVWEFVFMLALSLSISWVVYSAYHATYKFNDKNIEDNIILSILEGQDKDNDMQPNNSSSIHDSAWDS